MITALVVGTDTASAAKLITSKDIADGKDGVDGADGRDGVDGAAGLDSDTPRAVLVDSLRAWRLAPGAQRRRRRHDAERDPDLQHAVGGYASLSNGVPTSDVIVPTEVLGANDQGTGNGYATLNFEPSGNGKTTSGAWQRWNVHAGKVWSTRAHLSGVGTAGECGTSAPCTPSRFIELNPKAEIQTIKLKIGHNNGSGWTGLGGWVDDVRLGFDGLALRWDLGARRSDQLDLLAHVQPPEGGAAEAHGDDGVTRVRVAQEVDGERLVAVIGSYMGTWSRAPAIVAVKYGTAWTRTSPTDSGAVGPPGSSSSS